MEGKLGGEGQLASSPFHPLRNTPLVTRIRLAPLVVLTHAASSSVDPISSLRHRGFLLYLLSSTFSNVGNQMRIVTVNWEVWERTHLELNLGYIGLALAVPVISLALFAGTAADRYSRRWLIIVGQFGLALCGIGLALVSYSKGPLPVVYLLLIGTGTFRVIAWPAAAAIVPGMVPAPIFPNAAMWRSVMFHLAAAAGPLLGGLLIHIWHPWAIYLLDSATSLFMVGAMFLVQVKPHERAPEPKSWLGFLQGVQYLRRQPIILSTMTLDLVAVLFGGATAMLPAYADKILGVGSIGFGWMRAMQSMGAIAMGLLLAVRPPFRRSGHALLGSVTAFGIATLLFAQSTSYPLSLFALFIMGAADNISVVIRATVLQLLTPDSMRGRVTAVSVIFIETSNEIGAFESGVAARWLGLVPSVVFGGTMTLVTVVVTAVIWPELVRLGPLEKLKPPEPSEADVVT